MKQKFSLAFKFALAAFSLSALAACSETAATGEAVPIPTVRFGCTTNDCQNNPDSTTYAAVFTTSSCSASSFGEAVRYVSVNNSCSGSGCIHQTSSTGWADQGGNATATMPSGTYSLCGCIDLDSSSPPFENCDQLAEIANVSVGQNTLTQTLSTWQ